MVERESQVVVWITQNQAGTELTNVIYFTLVFLLLTSVEGVYCYFLITVEYH